VSALGLVRVMRSDVFDGLAHLRQTVADQGATTPDRRSSV
jgi:hypothetical protein